ncbi:hypothetical protein [Rhodococcus qingshengii]|uniref:hypothetical protein n=1 Tax=Rhodococcus qingshengii TaxID=334542 RepID=UPI0035D7F589
MTIYDPQVNVRSFVRDLVHANIRHGMGGGTDLKVWVEIAVREKLRRDSVHIYPVGSESSPNMIFLEHDLAYFPKKNLVLQWRMSSRSDIKKYQRTDSVPESDLLLEPYVRENTKATTFCVVHIPYDSNNVSDIGSTIPWSTDSEEGRKSSAVFVENLTQTTIMRPSKRDQQRMVGPSDLADTCNLCLARKLAALCGIPVDQPTRLFSHKAWLGTSIHEKLETGLPLVYPRESENGPRYHQELAVPIGTIRGLGDVHGHFDLYIRDSIVDYKSSDRYRIKMYQKDGVPNSHNGQTKLYLKGVNGCGQLGRYAVLVYIPRDSSDLSDIWVASDSADEELADSLLGRAQRLTEMVRSGSISDLVPEQGCFVCTKQFRMPKR